MNYSVIGHLAWLPVTLAMTIVAPTAASQVVFVDDDAPPGGDGESWETAFCSLQDALAEAKEPGGDVDEIRIGQGVYKPDQGEGQEAGDRMARFGLVNGVAVRGGFAGFGAPDPDERDIERYETILSGDLAGDDDCPGTCAIGENSYNVVTGVCVDGTAVLDGVTIRAGNGSQGAGLLNYDGHPRIANCVFAENRARVGGGIFNDASHPEVTGCRFVANTAERLGGGIYNWTGSLPTYADCVFEGNMAGEAGGGMRTSGSDVTALRCVFRGNAAGTRGGGMAIKGGQSVAVGCVFTGNTATQGGGGVASVEGDAVIDRCILSDNRADLGAGLFVEYGNPLLINCAVVGNEARLGGGIYIEDQSRPNLVNCTVAGNTAAEGGAMYSEAKFFPARPVVWSAILWNNAPEEIVDGDLATTTVFFSAVQGGWTGAGYNNIDADPRFIDPAQGNWRLRPTSPAIDAGVNEGVPDGVVTDLDGNPRFVDDPETEDTGNGKPPIVDMGAYEFQACPADLDGDGVVGSEDLIAVLTAWGHKGGPEDLDGSGIVDIGDVLVVLTAWGPCP